MARESRPPLATDGKKTTAEASHEASRTRRKRRHAAAIAGGLVCVLGIGIAIAATQAPSSRATNLGPDAVIEDTDGSQGGAAEYSAESLYRSEERTSSDDYESALVQPEYDAWDFDKIADMGSGNGTTTTTPSGSGGNILNAESQDISLSDPPAEQGVHVYTSADEWLQAQARTEEAESLTKEAAYNRYNRMCDEASRPTELPRSQAEAELRNASPMTFTVELGHGIRAETLDLLFKLLNDGDFWFSGVEDCWQLDMYIGAVSPTQRPIAVIKFIPPAEGSFAFSSFADYVQYMDLKGYCKACLGMSRLVRQIIDDDEVITVAADASDFPQGNVSVEATAAFTRDRLDANRWEYEALGFEDAWSTVTVDRKNTIAVIDTGFAPEHVDLKKMYVGAYNATTQQKGIENLYPVDYHGTHVAGILAAEAGNGSGISGLSHNANIMPVQVGTRDASGNTHIETEHLWRAFKYVLDNASDYNVKVINVSLSSTCSNPLQRAQLQARYNEYVEAAANKGILVVAAAGNLNGGTSSYKSYPATLPGALGVMSLVQQSGETAEDIQYSCASDSNYNESADTGTFAYEVGAPGVNILSCYPYKAGTNERSNTAFAFKSGTSMAAPQVSALASLVYAIDPGLTPAEVKDAICQNADRGRVNESLVVKQGYGAIRPAETVRYAHNRAFAPFTLRLGSANGEATSNASYASNMAGAEYSVTDVVSNKEVGTLTFDGSSMEATIELVRGRSYRVEQTKAPLGFFLNATPFDVVIPRLAPSEPASEIVVTDPNALPDAPLPEAAVANPGGQGDGGNINGSGGAPPQGHKLTDTPSGTSSAAGGTGEAIVGDNQGDSPSESMTQDILLTPQLCFIEVRCVDVTEGEPKEISCRGGDENRFEVALYMADEDGNPVKNADGSPAVLMQKRTNEDGTIALGPVAPGRYVVRQLYSPYPYGLADGAEQDCTVTVIASAPGDPLGSPVMGAVFRNKIRLGGITLRVVDDVDTSVKDASYYLVADQDVKGADNETIYTQGNPIAMQKTEDGRYSALPGAQWDETSLLSPDGNGIIDVQGLQMGNHERISFTVVPYAVVAGHVKSDETITFGFDENGNPDEANGTAEEPKVARQVRNGVVTRLVAANDDRQGIPGATMAMWPQSESVVYQAGSEESYGEIRAESAEPMGEEQAAGVQVEELKPKSATPAANQCTITFRPNTGNSNAKNTEKTMLVTKNQPVTLEPNKFTKKGSKFVGWSTGSMGNALLVYADQQRITPTGNMVLYARWAPSAEAITLTFKPGSQGQGTDFKLSCKSEDIITLPSNQFTQFTRDGYTFVGWRTVKPQGGTATYYQSEGEYEFTRSTTLYARWEKNSKTIAFDQNGGQGGMDKVSAQKGDRITLPSSQFTRKGYTFVGWNTNRDGTGQAYANQAGVTIEDNMTLYAQWEVGDAVIIRTPDNSMAKPSAIKVDASNTSNSASAEIVGQWNWDIQAWVIEGLAPKSRYHVKFGDHRVKTIQTSDEGKKVHYARYAPLTYQAPADQPLLYIKGCWIDQAALPRDDNAIMLSVTSGEAGAEGTAEFRGIVPEGGTQPGVVQYAVVELLPPSDISKNKARICSTEEHVVSIDRANCTVSANDQDWAAIEDSGVFHDGETTLEIYRKSSKDGIDAALIGREMKLTDAYGHLIDQWVTQDEKPRVFFGLAPGAYYITDIVSEDAHVIADTVEVALMPTTNRQRATMFDAPFVIGVDVDLQQEIAKPLDNADMEDGDGENQASVGNRPAGEYSYSLDFASRSNGWVDEMTITQELPSKDGLAELVSVTTPQTWQDHDGKMSVWYMTDKSGDAVPDDEASTEALADANARQTAYAGWRLWRAEVPAMEATRLSLSDLRGNGALAEDEHVTAIRLAYGRVEKWFATHKPPADSADAGEEFNKDPHDDVDEVVREHPETVQQVDPQAAAVREQETRAAAGEVVDALGKALGDNALSALGSTEDASESKNISATTQAAGSSEDDANWQETRSNQLDAYGKTVQESSAIRYVALPKGALNKLRVSSNALAGLHTQSSSTQESQSEGLQDSQPVTTAISGSYASYKSGGNAGEPLIAQSQDENTVMVPITPELIALLQSAILEADFDAHYAPAVITMRATEEYRAGKTLVSRAQALLHVHRPDGKGVTVEGTDSGYAPVIYDVNGGTVRVEGTGDGGIITTSPAGSDDGSDFLYYDDDDDGQQGLANKSAVAPQPQTTPASSDAIPATSNYDTVQQSAKHRDVGIGTRLTASSGAKTVGLSNKSVTLTDEVHYEGLSTNRMYTVTGELHVRAGAGAEGDVFDGGVASANGKSLVAAVEFVPAESSGTVPVLFEVPASSVGACPLVAFETICEGRVLEGGGEVARHADINDAEQTVEIVSDSVPQAGGQSGAAGQPAANFPWGTGSTGASGGSANGGAPGSGSTFFGNGSRRTGNAGAPGPTSSIAQTGDAVVVAAVTLAAAGGIAFAAIRKMREGNNA